MTDDLKPPLPCPEERPHTWHSWQWQGAWQQCAGVPATPPPEPEHVRYSPDYVEHRQRAAPPTLTPEAAEAYRRAEHCRALLQVVHQVCTQAGVPTDDAAGEPYTAAERVGQLQRMGTPPA